MSYPTATLSRDDGIRRAARNGAKSEAGIVALRTVVPFAADCLAVLAAGFAATWPLAPHYGIISNFHSYLAQPRTLRVLAILFCVAAYLVLRGRHARRIPLSRELQLTGAAVLYAMAADVALGAADHDVPGRLADLVALAILPACLTATGWLARCALLRSGAWSLPVLAVGDGPGLAAAEAALLSCHRLGYRLAGRLAPAVLAAQAGRQTLRSVLDQHSAERLVIAVDGGGELEHRLIEAATRERIPFAVARAVPGLDGARCRLDSPAAGMLMLWPHESSFRAAQRALKSVMDVTLAGAALVLIAPLLLVVAVAIRRDGGPALFSHRRLGVGGRHFHCLKFRTMIVDADRVLENALASDPDLAAEWNATHKLKQDPRVTRLGAFLRRTSLDELPQLINVLRLEMSLVGPRPITDAEIRHYDDAISYYYAVRPGITGLWQVSGRSNTTYAQRVRLDVRYAETWSLWRDIVLLLRTIPAVLARDGAH